MSVRLTVSEIVLIAVLTVSLIVRAQTSKPVPPTGVEQDKWNSMVPRKSDYAGKTPSAVPRRDLSGIWDSASDGVQPKGALEHEALRASSREEGVDLDERNIKNPLPYTPLGEVTLKANKPADGVRAVSAALANDPVNSCEPEGFPRMELYELRTIEISETPNQVIYLNQFNDHWRIIWTDGRQLPKDPEPRWNGYSVGKWVDDYTFVAETVGMDERTWLDNVGRPHSSDLHVEERFHRVNNDILELTVTIDDPKMYARPWIALNKLQLHLQRPDFDIREMICSPSEAAEYTKANNDADAAGAKSK